MFLREFHNALRILGNIERDELLSAGVTLTDLQWSVFQTDPFRWLIKASDEDAPKVWALIEARQPKDYVTSKFLDVSAKAAIKALRGLEPTAIMLDTYAPEVFPEVNEHGQIHFGRAIMESAAQAIRQSWVDAIAVVEKLG